MTEEMIDVVDGENKVVDVRPISEVRKKVLTHRGVDILLVNSKKEVFVHQRAAIKKTFSLYWGLFAGGFVSSGEDYEEAGLRELEEETGVKATELEFLGKFRYKVENDDWFGKLFKCVSDQEIKLQKEEIEQGFFIPLTELAEFVKTHKIKPSNLFIYEKFKEILK